MDQKKTTKISPHNFTTEEDDLLRDLVGDGQNINWQTIANQMRDNHALTLHPKQYQRRWKNHLKISNQKTWDGEEIKHVIKLFQKFGPEYGLISDTMQGRSSMYVHTLIRNLIHKAIRHIENKLQNSIVRQIGYKGLSKLCNMIASKSFITSQQIKEIRNRLINVARCCQENEVMQQKQIQEVYELVKKLGKDKGILFDKPDISENQKQQKPVFDVTDRFEEKYWNFNQQIKLCQLFFNKDRKISEVTELMIYQFGITSKFKDSSVRCKITSLIKSAIDIILLIAKSKYPQLQQEHQLSNVYCIAKRIMKDIQMGKNKLIIQKLINLNFDHTIDHSKQDKEIIGKEIIGKEGILSVLNFTKGYEGGRRIRKACQTQHISLNRNKLEQQQEKMVHQQINQLRD